MSNTFRYIATGVVLSFVLLVWSDASVARLTNITLEELVAGSTLIAYGRTETKDAEASSVGFAVTTFLKMPSETAEKKARICNDATEIESYDLSLVTRTYVVFAAAKNDCYAPIHGLRSVVQVRDDIALTGNISGQPAEQPLDNLLSKIRVLVGEQSSK